MKRIGRREKGGGGEERKRRGRRRRRDPEPPRFDLCLQGQIHTAGIRGWLLDTGPSLSPCPQPALISSRRPRFAKAAAHQGLVFLPFAHTFGQRVPSAKGTARKLFLRAAWDFLGWLQRSESNLQLLCGRPRGLGRECFSWRGSSLGPGTVWPPHKSLESPPG